MVKFRLTDKEYEELLDYCLNNNITLDQVVNMALKLYLQKED